MRSRALLLFENSIRSEYTRKQYHYQLQRFVDYYKLKDIDSIIRIEQKKLQIMVEDYVMHLKTRISPNSFHSPMGALQSFLEINDISLNWKKIRRLIPEAVKKSGLRGYTDAEIRKMLEFALNRRAKALIHFFASSGVRIGAFDKMEIKQIIEMPEGCKAVVVYPETKDEYWTFLTPEASRALDDYFAERRQDGEHLGPNSPVFRVSYSLGITRAGFLSKISIMMIVYRILNNAGLRTNKKNQRYEVQLDHGFRKRFITKLKLNKDIPVAVTERLCGHSTYTAEDGTAVVLDGAYMRPELDQLFEHFQKGISDLTLDDREKLIRDKQKALKEKSELQKALLENEQNKKELDSLKQWKKLVDAHMKRDNMKKHGTTDPEII